MVRRWRLAGTLLPLLLAVVSGCEPVVEPTSGPDVAPEVARQILRADQPGPGATVTDDRGNEYTLVEGRIPPDLPSLSVSSIMDASGGTLSLAGHSLTVPTDAVTTPTIFVMTVLPDGRVEVELQALVSNLLGMTNVGERGFARPISLSLSYAYAENVADPSRLKILHLRDDGAAEPLPATVDPTGRTVTAALEHFSKYCMAMD